MGPGEKFTKSSLAVAAVLVLLSSGPGAALAHGPDLAAPGLPLESDPAGMKPVASEQSASSIPGPQTDFAAWNAWSHQQPLPRLIHEAQTNAAQQGQMLVPQPDAFPGYDEADEPQQREAWRSWWLAAELGAMRNPSVALDPTGGSHEEWHQNGDVNGDVNADVNDDHDGTEGPASPLGDPHSLERLWRLQAHGAPRMTLPAGSGEQMYIVTDRGVLFIPEAGAQPDWMLNLEGIAGQARLIERDSGRNDLVIGMHSGGFDDTAASIWVIDGEEERITFRGLRGERSLLQWTLTDVDGDGEEDILGIDQSGNITAVTLGGDELYRTPVPEPELPEQSLPPQSLPDPLPDTPEFPLMALSRTGMEVFGDATGDGTMDLFATSIWGAGLFRTTAWVTLVDGADGQEVWTQTLDPMPDAYVRTTTPTVTGDLTGDGLADVGILDYGSHMVSIGSNEQHNLYLRGETGALFARDTAHSDVSELGTIGLPVPWEPIHELQFYQPIAIADVNGDGEQEIVAMGTEWTGDSYRPFVQVREMPPAGGATLVRESHLLEANSNWYLPAETVQTNIRYVDDEPVFIFLVPQWMTEEGDPGALFDFSGQGFRELPLDEPVGHYDLDPHSGQRYAWTLNDDRFTPVDESLQPTGNGTRILMSANPLVAHSLGGATPDLLIPRTLGYFWVSGRTGAIMSEVGRPPQTDMITGVEHDGRALVLERTQEDYLLFDARAEEEVGKIARSDVPGDAGFHSIRDVTGDRQMELVFREYGWRYTVCDPVCREEHQPDQWHIIAFNESRPLWTLEADQAHVAIGDVLSGHDGQEVVILTPTGDSFRQEDTDVALYTSDDQERAWSRTVGFVEDVLLETGHVVLVTRDENWQQQLVVLDAGDGSTAWQRPVDEGSESAWMQVAQADDGPLLVHSYIEGGHDDDLPLKQYVVVTRLADPQEEHRFDVTAPRERQVEAGFAGHSYTITMLEPTLAGPVLGDWDEDGTPEMALREGGWPSVRSLKDGAAVAVGTLPGSFNRAIDLNDDGRHEVGMLSGGSLRMFAYNPDLTQLEREDPLERVDAVDPDEGDQNGTAFFDGDEERSPGPGVLLPAIAVLAGAAAMRRRKGRRGD